MHSWGATRKQTGTAHLQVPDRLAVVRQLPAGAVDDAHVAKHVRTALRFDGGDRKGLDQPAAGNQSSKPHSRKPPEGPPNQETARKPPKPAARLRQFEVPQLRLPQSAVQLAVLGGTQGAQRGDLRHPPHVPNGDAAAGGVDGVCMWDWLMGREECVCGGGGWRTHLPETRLQRALSHSLLKRCDLGPGRRRAADDDGAQPFG